MVAKENFVTVKDTNGQGYIKCAKELLNELKVVKVALRRVNFLSKTFNKDNIYLQEIAQISGEALTQVSGVEKDD